MGPDEADDVVTDAETATGIETPAEFSTSDGQPPNESQDQPLGPQPEVVDGLDEGGDPPCWIGLIDDQRDHQ